jgi:selenium metabolism protein YedF
MKTIDCRNMACPAPVITTKRALDEAAGGAIQMLVDLGAPRENVSRFAASRGCTVSETPVEGGVALTLTPAPMAPAGAAPAPARTGPTVMLVTADALGADEPKLGKALMKNFIMTLVDQAELPDRMLFLNSGVLLTCEGSDVLEALEALENRGVELMSCGICLDYFHKKDQLRAGVVTNMFTTAESLLQARSVIRL